MRKVSAKNFDEQKRFVQGQLVAFVLLFQNEKWNPPVPPFPISTEFTYCSHVDVSSQMSQMQRESEID